MDETQKRELEEYKLAVEAAQPRDLVQFSAEYFFRKLANDRKVWFESKISGSDKDQYAENLRYHQKSDASKNDFSFKSPFSDHDPHTTNVIDHNSAGKFKQNFSLNEPTDPTQKGASPIDPSTPQNSEISNLQKIPMNFNALRRTSVSGETFEPHKLDSDWKPEHYTEKAGEQLKRLEKSIRKNFLFNQLDAESKTLVINSLEEKKVSKNTDIIKQGEEGDFFYAVEQGNVEYYVDGNKVNQSGPGSSFGELALMYNSPRAATVTAVSDCVLWALDRTTFRKILLGHSFQKRLLYDDFLRSVPILKSLSTYDRAKIADALETEIYQPGDVIIKEGDVGEEFYFIEYGSAEVSKASEGVVANLKPHDYFGEIALIDDLPRQATVTATSKTKVAALGKSAFQRLLGPVVNVLKLNYPSKN